MSGGVKVPRNIFEIYDGRKNFWQWDIGQKLIILDEGIDQVHFSNKNMNHSITRDVYEYDGKKICNVPDIMLQSPTNLVAYAYIYNGESNHTVKSVKFAVMKRPIPDDMIDIDGGNGNDEPDDMIQIWDGGGAAGY